MQSLGCFERTRGPGLTELDDLTLKESGEGDYGLSIRASIRGLWNGSLDYFSFVDSMIITINRGFTRAWFDGASTCGISPGELTAEERNRLDQEAAQEATFVIGLADDIIRNSKANGGKLGPLIARSRMWVNRYRAIANIAQTYACGDKKYKWVLGPTEQHCPSCSKMEGRVYRGSVWKKYGIAPRIWALACHGVHCLCELVPTDAPATPGRPPSLP